MATPLIHGKTFYKTEFAIALPLKINNTTEPSLSSQLTVKLHNIALQFLLK